MAPERQREDYSSVPWRAVKALARTGLLSSALIAQDALQSSTPHTNDARMGGAMQQPGDELLDFEDVPDNASLFGRTVVLRDEEGELRIRLMRTKEGEILFRVDEQTFGVRDTLWGTPVTRFVDDVTKESSTAIALRSPAVPQGRILVETRDVVCAIRILFADSREVEIPYRTGGRIPGALRVLQAMTGSTAKIECTQVAWSLEDSPETAQ